MPDLTSIPMVSDSRARLLQKIKLRSIGDIARADPEVVRRHPKVVSSKDTSFSRAFPLINKYAQAIRRRRPIVVGAHPVFSDPPKSPYFIDLEYNPQGTNGTEGVGIFLYGILGSDGNIVQRFLDDPRQERELIEWFSNWLLKRRPALITYSSKSADEPQLRNGFRKFGMPSDSLSAGRFLDLFYDVIFTQSPETQKIFLPIKGDMSSKRIASYFGFREPKNIRIHDGFDALMAYSTYSRNRSKRIRRDLLAYNRCDLRRTKLIYGRLKQLFDQYSIAEQCRGLTAK